MFKSNSINNKLTRFIGVFVLLSIMSLILAFFLNRAKNDYSGPANSGSELLLKSQKASNDNVTNYIRSNIETRAILKTSLEKSDMKDELKNDDITNYIRSNIKTRAMLQTSLAKSDIKNELYSEAYLYHHPLLTGEINQYCSNNALHSLNEITNCNSASKMDNPLYYAFFSLSDPTVQSGIFNFIIFMAKLLVALWLLYFIVMTIKCSASYFEWSIHKKLKKYTANEHQI